MNATSKQIRTLKLDCAVPGCPDKAVTTASISINNAPKKRLPVCRCHADAAKEDLVKVIVPPAATYVKTVTIDRKAAIDDLKKLNGLPPYDTFNPCCGDGVFMKSLEEKYGMSITLLEQATDFKKLCTAWHNSLSAAHAQFNRLS